MPGIDTITFPFYDTHVVCLSTLSLQLPDQTALAIQLQEEGQRDDKRVQYSAYAGWKINIRKKAAPRLAGYELGFMLKAGRTGEGFHLILAAFHVILP